MQWSSRGPVKDEAERRALSLRSPSVTIDQRSSCWFDEPLTLRIRPTQLFDEHHRAVSGGRLTDPLSLLIVGIIVQAESGVS